MKLILVAGVRPNFMKIAPIIRALKEKNDPRLSWQIVHTGQHYDYEMSQSFFDDLELPKPDYFLGAGSGSHAFQTAEIMVAFERVCLNEKRSTDNSPKATTPASAKSSARAWNASMICGVISSLK